MSGADEQSKSSATDGADASLVTLALDVERCLGVGSCELLQPDQFRIDDDTAIAELIGDGRLSAADAEIVVDRCPSGAISIATRTDPV